MNWLSGVSEQLNVAFTCYAGGSGGISPLMSREELASETGLVRLCDQTQIRARSEKLVVGQIDGVVGWQYNVLVDP